MKAHFLNLLSSKCSIILIVKKEYIDIKMTNGHIEIGHIIFYWTFVTAHLFWLIHIIKNYIVL